MPRLAIAKNFLGEYAKLEKSVQSAVESAIGKFERTPTPACIWKSCATAGTTGYARSASTPSGGASSSRLSRATRTA